jgi:hypothetical protein
MRILKRYNNLSAKNGILEWDKVTFSSKEEGAAWLLRLPVIKSLAFEVIDFDWALIDTAKSPEIIFNPTGGLTGVVKDPRKLV